MGDYSDSFHENDRVASPILLTELLLLSYQSLCMLNIIIRSENGRKACFSANLYNKIVKMKLHLRKGVEYFE